MRICLRAPEESRGFYLTAAAGVGRLGEDVYKRQFHSSAGHHAGAVTSGDGAGGKHHVFPVAQGRCLRTAGRGVFLHGQGFPCEGGFLRFQVDRFQKPGVGRNEIPGLQQKNVSGHQILRGDFLSLIHI